MRRQPVIVMLKRTFLLAGLTALVFGLLFLSPWLYSTEKGYTYLSELPYDFVQAAQQAEKTTGVSWQLLASYYQLELEKEVLDAYPADAKLRELAEQLSQAPDTKRYRILAEEAEGMFSAKEIKTRHRLLKAASPLYSGAYLFPLPKEAAKYVDTWHADRDGGKRRHQGTDLFAKEGTPVYAVVDGMIERKGNERLGGERVGLRGKEGLYYYFAHLSAYAPGLKEGQIVKKGELLGYVGHTGNAQGTPDHLHFGIRTANGKWFNPYNFLKLWEETGN